MWFQGLPVHPLVPREKNVSPGVQNRSTDHDINTNVSNLMVFRGLEEEASSNVEVISSFFKCVCVCVCSFWWTNRWLCNCFIISPLSISFFSACKGPEAN
ncbi:hypothetical protein PAMP_012735 [Pampus punctatissimus]